MILYAIRIDGKYFKDYIYLDNKKSDRYAGHTALGATLQEGDIIGVKLTSCIQRTEVSRSIGNTIATLYGIESLKDKVITIIPVYE